jgi:hypothetical protein
MGEEHMTKRPPTFHLIHLFMMVAVILTACGTVEVGVEPGATAPVSTAQSIRPTTIVEPEPASTETAIPLVPTAIPTVTEETIPEPSLLPTPEPVTPAPSPLWVEYRDPRYGFGMALPCYWHIIPTSLQGFGGSPSISSYDEHFFLNRSVRGSWKDNIWPGGAIKFDIWIREEIDPASSLIEAVGAFEEEQAVNDPFAVEVLAVEEVTLARHQAVRVTKADQGEDAHSLSRPNQYHAFRMSPESVLFISVSPRQALEYPEVQGILDSLALSQEEAISIPTRPPSGPLEGRDVYLHEEAGYCFAYPSEFSLEPYDASSASFIGEIASLKLERPLYTVGMILKSWRVGQLFDLVEWVDQHQTQFSDIPSVERNGPNWYNLRLDGRPAEVLDGIPGEVRTLDVFVVNGDRMFQLTTSPTMTGYPESSVDVGFLFGVVTSTFTFLPAP